MIVRNDNVWVKPNPIPDQVRDRCSMSHEYMFHMVKSRWYYFKKEDVGRKSTTGSMLPPPDTWEIPAARRSHKHKARFSEELVRIPILATTQRMALYSTHSEAAELAWCSPGDTVFGRLVSTLRRSSANQWWNT